MALMSSNWAFNHETTINHAEIEAIKIAFESIWDNFDCSENFESITIFTVSLFGFKLFTNDSYPK